MNPPRWWQRRRPVLIACLAADAVLLFVVLMPTPLLNPVVEDAADRSMDCVETEGLDVDVDGWPVLPRAVFGGLPGATVTADRITGNGFVAHDVSAELDDLSFRGRTLFGGDGPVRAERTTATAVLTPADLTAMARQHTGLPVDVTVSDDALAVRAGIGPFGLTAPVTLRAVSGSLVATASSPLPGLAVRSLISGPPELHILRADPRDDGLHVAVSITPDTDLSELLCRPVRVTTG